jgi:hypothetical protein
VELTKVREELIMTLRILYLHMKILSIEMVLGVELGLFLLSSMEISAQPLEQDTPTGNLTEDIDIAINPGESLPANGTVILSTEGATDMDINEFPPAGVSVIIRNESVIVTNNPVSYE